MFVKWHFYAYFYVYICLKAYIGFRHPRIGSVAKVVLFSVVSVCVCVCLST